MKNNKLNKIVQQAILYHQKGDLKNAEKYYKRVISLDSNISDTYANLGLIYQTWNNINEAKIYYKKAIYRKTKNIDIYNRLGYIYQQDKNIIEAKIYYKKSLEINSNQFGIYINLGNIYKENNDFINAEKYYKQAISINPNYPDIYYNLGNLYKNMNRGEEAKKCYEKVISLNNNHFQAYNSLGSQYQEKKEYQETLAYYIKSLKINPNQLEICNNILALSKELDIENIEEYYKLSLSINPKQSKVLINLGKLYNDEDKLDEAEKYYKKAININPNRIEAYNNLGTIYKDREEFEKAEEYYKRAISINSNYKEAYRNLGSLYNDKNNINLAKKYYNKAISIDSNYLDAIFSLSFINLKEQDYKIGFEKYKLRYHNDRENLHTPIIDEKSILNSIDNIKNRTILITREQGFGDLIQFVRFLPKFIDLGAKIICEVAPELLKLFQYNYPQIKFIDNLEDDIKFDYNFPMLDICYLFGTTYDTIPYSSGYLEVDKANSIDYKLDIQKIKIGINWQGSKGHINDKNRSINLDLLLNYLNKLDNRFQIYSLQYDIVQDEDILLQNNNIINLGSQVSDFYDTALFIDSLDLIISVDSSVAHLSASMNKKTFILLPFASDWRWGLDGNKTNWYDSITLFRQKEISNWNSVLEEVVLTINNKGKRDEY